MDELERRLLLWAWGEPDDIFEQVLLPVGLIEYSNQRNVSMII